MTPAKILKITDATTLDECAQAANQAGMYLITNGLKVVVSPVVPAGFVKLSVKVKTPQLATVEAMPCAA